MKKENIKLEYILNNDQHGTSDDECHQKVFVFYSLFPRIENNTFCVRPEKTIINKPSIITVRIFVCRIQVSQNNPVVFSILNKN
ncbi:hypothetical protein BpHYR1_032196 [Brachionus plicatilis]|uniref:Uncharacterized protein n=1 Tax=Brachionus plicatilis TaxID=10195 RepID=A0A3M7S1W8_BRAPC|nr:hypothetical protein BpHYR1_032196 [Brachionus plicatilis]